MNNVLAILMELGKALNVPDDKLKELVADKDAGEIDGDELVQTYKETYRAGLNAISRNAAFDKKKTQDEAYKAAERKLKREVEDMVRQKFGLEDTEAKGLDELLNEAWLQSTAGKEDAMMSDDAVKAHPAYAALEAQLAAAMAEMAAAQQQAADEVAAVRAGYEYEKLFGEVAADALKLFDEMRPVQSADPAKAAKQRQWVVDALRSDTYQRADGGWQITNAEGHIQTNEQGQPLSLKDHVKARVGDFFDFRVAEERRAPNGATGRHTDHSSMQKRMAYSGPLPKTKQEAVRMINDERIDLNHRIELQQWAEVNAAQLEG